MSIRNNYREAQDVDDKTGEIRITKAAEIALDKTP